MVAPMITKTLGILGGGQLGRMSALAAARLGIQTVIFTPEENSPASQVTNQTIVAPYDNKAALTEFAALCDSISYEFENIPVETVEFLMTLKPVHPDTELLKVAQDRLTEKKFLNEIGISTARWFKLGSEEELHVKLQEWGADECIIKTSRFGYDGKGQIKYNKSQKLSVSIENLKGELIVEELIQFEEELSVIIARDTFKNIISYGPVLNEHQNHILHKTFSPAPFSNEIKTNAISMGKNLAEKINLTGLLTLELFLKKDGTLLANEIAPRTHNSGHYSIDACNVSQFENHVRAVCGLPVVQPIQTAPAEMLNLIGDDAENIEPYLNQPNACVHLYGKDDIKSGRKMGHITFIKPNQEDQS